jgi:hypothetical protein
MPHFYERNVVEIKNEYTTFLTNIITPFMYEGIKSVYNFAVKSHNEFIDKAKTDPEVKSPGVLKIFQTCLKEIPTLNNNSIEQETNRIKDKSRCSEWFDDLIRAVVKSNIVLLTFSTSKNESDLIHEKYHEKIDIKDFIHKCYIESARTIYNNPELFWHEFPPIEIKRNQREICNLINNAVHEAIRKMLPIKHILEEYLKNDYTKDNFDNVGNRITDSQYMNVKSMVQRDLHGGEGVDREELKSKFAGQSLLDDDGEGNLLDDHDNGFEELEGGGSGGDDQENLLDDVKDIHNQLKDIEKEFEKDVGYTDNLDNLDNMFSEKSQKRSSRDDSKPSSREQSEQHLGGGSSRHSSRDMSEQFEEGSSRASSRASSRESSRPSSRDSSKHASPEQSSRHRSHKGGKDKDKKEENKQTISESDKSKYFSRYVL